MATGPRPLVLIVEDEPVIRGLLSGALDGAGLDVATVDMAQYALEAVKSHRPDVVLLDLGMPRGTMQGMDFLVLLRETEDWKALPVIILSGYGDIVNRDVTTRLGVRAVLSKPIADFSILIRAIRENLPPSSA